MSAIIIPFPKVHRNGQSPKLSDFTKVEPKREVLTEKLRKVADNLWRKS